MSRATPPRTGVASGRPGPMSTRRCCGRPKLSAVVPGRSAAHRSGLGKSMRRACCRPKLSAVAPGRSAAHRSDLGRSMRRACCRSCC
eukprot:3768673-Alexandrium_andersonii.AAC.1